MKLPVTEHDLVMITVPTDPTFAVASHVDLVVTPQTLLSLPREIFSLEGEAARRLQQDMIEKEVQCCAVFRGGTRGHFTLFGVCQNGHWFDTWGNEFAVTRLRRWRPVD